MGKGYKRKTRWRTLNIADCPSAPPDDQDDEDGRRKPRENGTRSNGQGSHKSSIHSKNEQRNENGITTSDTSVVLPSRSQPKFIFDENEYTRITTPRQDVLFKKGYLARKKVWSGNNASTSATPSTTESQSASHSTADGSETTEDQQLLDYRENGIESYPPPAESAPQMSYGTFYDHASGYYYEYPMMLMGPPMPGPPMHNVLATMPCQAVPLRPIEWVNPAFVPKIDQSYCFVDYQMDQQYPVAAEEKEVEPIPIENTNGVEEPICENGNGNASWAESVASEEQTLNDDDHQSQHDKHEPEETQDNENYDAAIVDGNFTNEPPLETVLAQQLHVSHHVLPAVPQPYMYPGHYMFGPALMNVNGMTIQSGQMMRTSEINGTTSAFVRSKKKKKMRHRKSRRPLGSDNIAGYGPEEEDYSSEAENVKTQSSVIGASTFVSNNTTKSSRPLNPNCKEFEFKTSNVESQTISPFGISTNTPTAVSTVENNAKDSQPSETKLLNNGESYKITSIEDINESTTEISDAITNIEYAAEAISNESCHTNGFCEIQETEIGVDVTCAEFNDIVEKLEENCAKLSLQNNNTSETIIVTEYDHLPNGTNETRDKNETQRLANHENLSKNNAPKNKYKGGVKIIRESTPGPRLDEQHPCTSETEIEMHINCSIPMGVDAIEAQMSADTSNEDSGFESQTRFSDHPITDAVTQWLRRANSPELFITAMNGGSGLAESDMEDDELEDSELSKNLQGNPMPALSANSIVNDVETMSSRTASCSEFARVNNCPRNNAVVTMRKKKKRSGNGKKRIAKCVDNVEIIEKKIHDNDKLNSRQQRKKSRAAARQHAKSLVEQNNDVCEFTAKDSDAGMRVAASTRINLDMNELMSKNDKNERTIESSRDMTVNRVEMDIDKVKTFEQGQIVVSIDGKLLPNTIYGVIRSSNEQDTNLEEQLVNVSEKNSIGSIEEPDMLECWEAETIESINPKQLLKDRELYQNNEIDDDINCTKVDNTSLELVRKYYTLARGSVQSFSSIENGVSDVDQLEIQSQSKLIMSQQIIETICSEKTTTVTEPNNMLNKRLSIDDGIEVYESCYTGQRPPIFITPNFYKSHLHRDEDGPIPCKAACCMIQ
ncbi:hypothetical protein PV328_003713 [Microctonus aethiopoides]|uniref:Uncharacterized protein n=1 Tax=Microctonus aethiopoides TaxID=144406 RepID=A0AA39F983_9HYME|nr:hypothetical protein PV328_003713 [Microctonus aethiopoides]